MGSPRLPRLTKTLLQSYSKAALRNADELLAEASLLRDNKYIARAYFLAVACIEEAGKALLAFDAQNRNLSDPAVSAKLQKSMGSHTGKITYALTSWALSNQDQRKALKVALNLISHIKRGREPSMDSELRSAPDRAQTPREVVRDSAARDCVMLAEVCLAHSHYHVIEKVPIEFTSAQDRV
jgi:AbiV family abortive infection protein